MSALTLAFDDSESPKKPTAAFVHVTPEIAARWLRQNTRNRTIRQHLVDRFTRDMQAGEWHLDGAPIRFAPDGTLLDGQHRLTAIVSTGITVPIPVVRGIDPSAQAVMDTGAARTAADALSIDGRENASTLAATAALAIRAETDRLDTTGQKGIVSHSEILRWIDENPDAPAACEFARKYSRKTDATPSLVAYTYLILSRIDAGDAARFWVDAAEKVGLSAGDPVIALTNRFAEARRNRQSLTKREALSAIYRAWNYRRAGKPLHLVKIRSTSGGIIPIPEPK